MKKDNQKQTAQIREEIINLTEGKLVFHADPGHGWLEVPARVLDLLKIRHKITEFSYLSNDGQIAYLEEDCDAATFYHGYMDFMCITKDETPDYTFIEHDDDCFIRELPRRFYRFTYGHS